MAIADILLPTCNRLESIIFTLSGVASQTVTDIRVIIADQSDRPVENSPVIKTLQRPIEFWDWIRCQIFLMMFDMNKSCYFDEVVRYAVANAP